MNKAIGTFRPLNNMHNAFEVATLQPSTLMQKPGYSGTKTDGSIFHVFTEHWKWEPVWQGDGLPPVGTECEIKHGELGWVSCEIVAHKIMGCGGKTHAIAWIDGNTLDQSQGLRFRPFRTREQIAADEREQGVKELMDWVLHSMSSKHLVQTPFKPFWEAAYDEGLRAPVKS